ncbi:hypothetical protein ABGB18_28845 [Nonomuraea sp. B12E4]|uniref:hypothetical protein n=1 Tax=Nonomuraea sp. B12E4 TaxID=3153564 RepID=UPI00325C7C67
MRACWTRSALLVLIPALLSCGAAPERPAAGSPPATARTSPSATAKPAPSVTASSSAFCLDLDTFNVALVIYASTVGKAVEGEPVDFKEARRLAGIIADYGEAMEGSVPPDIADAFHNQVKAVRKSSSRLSTRSRVVELVDPMYNDKAVAARKALSAYECV